MAVTLGDAILYLTSDDSGLDKGLDSAERKTRGWAGRLGGAAGKLVGGAVLGGVTAAAGAIASMGVAAFNVSRDTEQAAANIAASLGLPREEAERFAEVAQRVYGDNFAGSVQEAGDAVIELARQMGLAADDPALQVLAGRAFALADNFGGDVQEQISAANTLMQEFGLSGDEAFDLLARGFQTGLDRSGDFLDTIQEYSLQFGDAGAEADEFFSLLSTGLQGGMLGTDRAADLFKEFSVRIMDGSDATAEGLAAIGLSADEVAAGLADGTTTVIDLFNQVQGALATTEDPLVQFQAGVALMGTQFEDLGAEAVMALDTMAFQMAGAEGAADSLGAKYDNFGDLFSGVWRKAVVALAPATDKLLELANDAVPHVEKAFEFLGRAVPPLVEMITRIISRSVEVITRLYNEHMPAIRALVEDTLRLIQAFWVEHGDAIMVVVSALMTILGAIFDHGLKTVLDLARVVLQLLTGDFEGASETITGIIVRLWDTLRTIFGAMVTGISAIFSDFDWGQVGRNLVQGIINGVFSMGRGLFDAIRQITGGATANLGVNSAQALGTQTPVLAGAGAMGGGDGVSVQITQNFNGPADAAMVGQAAEQGAMSATGLRRGRGG